MRLEGFYVASRASVPARVEMWKRLRKQGVPINSTWIDEAGDGETNDFAELWNRITGEVLSSERLIAYLEPEDFPVRGVLVEIGMALGAHIPVSIVAPKVDLEGRSLRPIGSWLRHPQVTMHDTVEDALAVGERGLVKFAVPGGAEAFCRKTQIWRATA